MAGFANDVLIASNVNFTRLTGIPGKAATVTTDGQLLIGSTALPNIQIGSITSPGGTLTIGYSSPNITIDLAGGSIGIDSIGVDTTTGSGTNPVLPTAAGLVTLTGGQYPTGTFGTRVVTINSPLPNTVDLEVQISTASAAGLITNNGVSHFDSSSFSVSAVGFVTLSTIGALKTLTGDTGTATPVANNIQIAGGPGVTTSATGAIVTINSVVFTDTTAATLAVDNGYFATAAGTYALPATAVQGELLIVVCDTAGAVVLDAPALNFIRVGSLITSSGGTITSTSIGDSVTLRYRLSSLTWEAVSIIGTWLVA